MARSTPLAQRPPVNEPIEGITVTGEASRSISPDTVEFSFEICSSGPTAAMAVKDNTHRSMNLIQTLTQTGIGEAELQSGVPTVRPTLPSIGPVTLGPLLPTPAFAGLGSQSLMPVQTNVGLLESHPFANSAVNTLKVIVRDINRLGEVVDAGTRAGAAVTGAFLGRLREENVLRKNLLEEAVREARDKANSIAAALGKDVADPVSVHEDFQSYQIPASPGDGFRQAAFPTMSPVNARFPLLPGQLTFLARVAVTYRLQ